MLHLTKKQEELPLLYLVCIDYDYLFSAKNESDIMIKYMYYIPFYVRKYLALAFIFNLIKRLLRIKTTNNQYD